MKKLRVIMMVGLLSMGLVACAEQNDYDEEFYEYEGDEQIIINDEDQREIEYEVEYEDDEYEYEDD